MMISSDEDWMMSREDLEDLEYDFDEQEEYKTEFKRTHGKYLQIPIDKAKVVNRMSRGLWVTHSNHFMEKLICYRWFEGDRERLNELNPEIFPLFDDYDSVIWRCLKTAEERRVKVAVPKLICFTRDEIEAINNTRLRERQKRLMKVMIGLMKSRGIDTIYRMPKWSSICYAAGVEKGRGIDEFKKVMVKSGLFRVDIDMKKMDYGDEQGIKYTLNIPHKDDDEIVEIYRDIYDIFSTSP